jgi:hypothetical protein
MEERSPILGAMKRPVANPQCEAVARWGGHHELGMTGRHGQMGAVSAPIQPELQVRQPKANRIRVRAKYRQGTASSPRYGRLEV